MTASLSVSRPVVLGEGLSISPRSAGAAPPSFSSGSSTRELFSHAAIDRAALDELAATLRSLTDDALEASRRLAGQIATAENLETDTKRASADLHERLRLGARMLSAFQSQIVRIEQGLAELERREHTIDSVRTLASAAYNAGGD